jgi:hypothetical protein
LSNIWRFLSGCPKLELVSLRGNAIKDLNAFVPAWQGREDSSRTASRLLCLDLLECGPPLNDIEEDPEVLIALLNTHLHLEYKSDSRFFPPQVQYLMDIKRCGRILLEDRGITSIPLSVWPRILERTNNSLDCKVERNASALYVLLSPEWTCLGRAWR